MSDVALNVRVTGRVSGESGSETGRKTKAEQLGLTGWVRNETDGTVSALIAGPEAKVTEMVAALHQGPDLGSCLKGRDL